MATFKTEASELSLAFGILNRNDPTHVNAEEIPTLFEGTLSFEKFESYLTELRGPNNRNYERLLELGVRLRGSYQHFSNARSLRWLGPDRQPGFVTAAQDILVCNIPVSVKNESNVVYNLSPNNLFDRIPTSLLLLPKSDDWFQRNAPDELQSLYRIAVNNTIDHGLPEEYLEFERAATSTDRRRLQGLINNLEEPVASAFRNTYISICHHVSSSSADLFNNNYARTVACAERVPMLNRLPTIFFRLDSVPYLLSGIDGGTPFTVIVPSIGEWLKYWKIVNVQAVHNNNRGQCVVDFHFNYRSSRRRTSPINTLDFHAEVRWSHGKFCGNPEAKLYKNVHYAEVPFLGRII